MKLEGSRWFSLISWIYLKKLIYLLRIDLFRRNQKLNQSEMSYNKKKMNNLKIFG